MILRLAKFEQALIGRLRDFAVIALLCSFQASLPGFGAAFGSHNLYAKSVLKSLRKFNRVGSVCKMYKFDNKE